MKTNLVDLMSKVSLLEKEYNKLSYELRSQAVNTRIIELDGKSQMIEEYPDFDINFKEYLEMERLIVYYKGIIFEKNNSLKLKNGDTIQKTLVDIQNKRKALELIDILSRLNPSKRRTSETNNSYFTSTELAYNKQDMIDMKNAYITEIQNLELEISQLNSEIFEV